MIQQPLAERVDYIEDAENLDAPPDDGIRVIGLSMERAVRILTFYEMGHSVVGPNPRTLTPKLTMSLDKSLKRKGGMTRPRCVMTRAERIAKMVENGKWADGTSPFGLPKTRVQKVVLKKKKEKVAEGDAAAAPAAGAKPAAGGKK